VYEATHGAIYQRAIIGNHHPDKTTTLGTIKASQVVVLKEESVDVTQRKLMLTA